MRKSGKTLYFLGAITLWLALYFAAEPFSPGSIPSAYAASLDPYTTLHPQIGQTTAWANVRSSPTTNSAVVKSFAPGTQVSVYATTTGQNVWGNNNTWDRISILSSPPMYIYSPLITLISSSGTSSTSSRNSNSTSSYTPSSQGKVIVVSLSRQWLYAYQNGQEVFNAAVLTGRPSLPTPTGTYHVFAKYSPATFYSPWPPGSAYWYSPTHINYALEWREGGFFLHDSYWHTVYGPGTNVWHYDPAYGWQWGSHGCISMPLSAAAWLYNWAPIGTTVQVNA